MSSKPPGFDGISLLVGGKPDGLPVLPAARVPGIMTLGGRLVRVAVRVAWLRVVTLVVVSWHL